MGSSRDARNITPAGVLPGPSEAKLKRGRPPIIGERPWQVAGMSRRSWYRRKKDAIARATHAAIDAYPKVGSWFVEELADGFGDKAKGRQ